MYGDSPYGDIPYGDVDLEVGDLFDVDAMLSDSRAKLVYTVVLNVRNIAGDVTETLYFGSRQWVTDPTDYPATQEFEDRFLKFSFRRSILGETIGVFTTGDGSIVLGNADGAYDDIVNTYAVDGQEVTVRVGRVTDSFVDHMVIFKGQATDWTADLDTVTVTLRDFGYRLDVPTMPNTYLGTGSAEGGADLAGKRKPLLHGLQTGFVPVLINAALLIYQFHDGPVVGLVNVFDRGVGTSSANLEHTTYASLAAATISAGFVDQCRPLGLFRLGAAPSGEVFMDAYGEVQFDTVAGTILDLVTRATDLADDEIDTSSFDRLQALLPASTGHFVGPENVTTTADEIAKIMAGVGGWGGFDRVGRLTVGILGAPSGNPVAYFRHAEGDIVSLNRDRLPSGISPPPWRWRVGYGSVLKVFQDFAGGVATLDRAYYSTPYRLKTAEDAGILSDHPLAKDPAPIETIYSRLNDGADAAAAEAARRLALYSAERQLIRFTADRQALSRDIGNEINVTHPRFGLDVGRNAIILEMAINIDISDGSGVETVEIVAFG